MGGNAEQPRYGGTQPQSTVLVCLRCAVISSFSAVSSTFLVHHSRIRLGNAESAVAAGLPRHYPFVVEETAGGAVVGQRGEIDDDASSFGNRAGASVPCQVRGRITGSSRIDFDMR